MCVRMSGEDSLSERWELVNRVECLGEKRKSETLRSMVVVMRYEEVVLWQ